MRPELEKCMEHLSDQELTEQEKRELILAVWKVAQAFAKIGFGAEATQYALLAGKMNPRQSENDSLGFKTTPE